MSLLSHIVRIKMGGCSDCAIVPVLNADGSVRFNDVRICPTCRAKEKDHAKRMANLSLDEFIREVVNGRALLEDCSRHYEALYERYHQDMPYGTAKARDGDPYEWITEALYQDYGHLIEEEASV